jgi:hypothetical protein
VTQPVKIQVAQIYRREEDDWKLVHRHGDFAAVRQPMSQARARAGVYVKWSGRTVIGALRIGLPP